MVAPLGAAILLLIGARSAESGTLWWIGVLLMLAAAFCAFFFRDPTRRLPDEEDVLVAPADGRVTDVALDKGDPGGKRVSIFLSLFDVHINRSPTAGQVVAVRYRDGDFKAAFRRDAAERNERNELELTTARGTIRIRQIAGVVARRIVCRARVGDRLGVGERFGLIRFGSRTDLLLPPGVSIRVRRGDHVRGGATVIGKWE